MSKTAITILTTTAALVTAIVPAAAAPDALCIGYANRAVSQMANANRGCGYFGPRWHTWWDGHYAWCRSKTPNRLAAETIKRNKKLGQCFG